MNGVERWRVYASHHNFLEQLYTRLSSSDRLEPGGVDLLKSAFGLENLTFLSYDYLCTYSEEALAEEGIVEVNGKKKPKLKQVILEIIGKQLEEKGYRLNPESGGRNMPHQYIFSKLIGSYRYQVRVENWEKNKLELSYFPPYHKHSIMIFMRDNHRMEFGYSNEQELRSGLGEFLKSMLSNGVQWLEAQEIEEFDLNDIYRRMLDPVMENAGFQRKDTTIALNENYSYFIYSTPDGKWRILFSHPFGYPTVSIKMRRDNHEIDHVLMFPEKNADIYQSGFDYRNQKELGEQHTGAAQAFFELLKHESHLKYDPELRGFDF